MTTLEKFTKEFLACKCFPSTDPAYREIRIMGTRAEGVRPDGTTVDLTGKYLPMTRENLRTSCIYASIIDAAKYCKLSSPIHKWIYSNKTIKDIYLYESLTHEVVGVVVLKIADGDLQFKNFIKRDFRVPDDYTSYKDGSIIRSMAAGMQMHKNDCLSEYKGPVDSFISTKESVDNLLREEFNLDDSRRDFIATWLNGEIGGFIVGNESDHPQLGRSDFFPLKLELPSAGLSVKGHIAILNRIGEEYQAMAADFRKLSQGYDREYVTIIMCEVMRKRLVGSQLYSDELIDHVAECDFSHVSPEEARAELELARQLSRKEFNDSSNDSSSEVPSKVSGETSDEVTRLEQLLDRCQRNIHQANEFFTRNYPGWKVSSVKQVFTPKINYHQIDTIRNIQKSLDTLKSFNHENFSKISASGE